MSALLIDPENVDSDKFEGQCFRKDSTMSYDTLRGAASCHLVYWKAFLLSLNRKSNTSGEINNHQEIKFREMPTFGILEYFYTAQRIMHTCSSK